MKPLVKCRTASITAIMYLAVLLFVGVQVAIAAENTLTMSIGEMGDLGTDPTIYKTLMPGLAGLQDYHYYTHFSPLITLDGEGNIIPWMAESYDVSDDLKTITFHLRKGVKFADGTPLNSSILKFNFDRMLTYGLKDKFGNQTKADIFVNYNYCEASDDYTFKIHFTEGWLDMAYELAMNQIYGNFISPKDVDPEWNIKGMLKPEKKYNGLGPYYVDDNESISKEKIVLKRRSSWRDDLDFHKPTLDKIVLVLISDPQIAVMALEKGEIDYICRYWNAPLDTLSQIKENPSTTIKTSPESRMYFIRTAYWKEPFSGADGVLLRKAICYALNRTEMANGAFNGYATPATDSMGLSSTRPDVPKCCHKGYDYDLQKAKQLLADAGWNDTDGNGILDKNGKDLRNLDLVITSATNLIWQKDLAQVVQSQLKKIGINAEIRMVESGAYYELQQTGDFDLLMTYNMGRAFTSPQELKWFNLNVLDKSYVNYYSNQNETLARSVTNAQKAMNKEERNRSLCQACNILYEDAGIIPLVYEMQYAVMNNKIKGFEFGPSKNCYYLDHIEDCWIKS